MGFINDIAPSPADRPPAEMEDGGVMEISVQGPTMAFIYKSMSEPQVGMVSYFKVYSGKMSAGEDLTNQDNRTIERVNQIFLSLGKVRVGTDSLIAGDIGATVKLKNSHTNDTLGGKGADMKVSKMSFPPSKIRVAITPPGKNEMEKLMKALHQIEEEDPSLKVEQSATLKQTLLHGQGQLHLDLIKYRIEKVNGISMEFEKPKIPYRETITSSADQEYRHKKQSGGSGQFAQVSICLLYTSPSPRDQRGSRMPSSA